VARTHRAALDVACRQGDLIDHLSILPTAADIFEIGGSLQLRAIVAQAQEQI
jgi:hypothetical protein